MTVYAGYDVLEVEPSRDGAKTHTYMRPFNLLDTATGKRDADEDGPAPSLEIPFVWVASSRAEIGAMKTFLNARKGRAVPFWVPSYQRDLRLNATLFGGGSAFVIKRVGYSTLVFPDSNARRHLAFYTIPSAVPAYRKVLSAVESGGGTTEDLTVDSTLPAGTYEQATSVISFLRLCRLTNDENIIEWLDNKTARCNLSFTEIPLEAP